MDTTPLKLPIHDHPLFPTVRLDNGTCRGCRVSGDIYGGYYCNEPYCHARFHKECAEAPLEINHLSHPQHPLILLTHHLADGPCDLCGNWIPFSCYSCPRCEFKVDLVCGMKPSPLAIEHPPCHDHPLVFFKKQYKNSSYCDVCKESIYGQESYSCLECDVYFHVDCVYLSTELNHPCHSTHPLKLMASYSLTDHADKSCILCDREAKKVLYHCSICNFTTCLRCTKKPPPLVYEHTKIHKHPLTLFSKRISFTCDVCGKEGKTSPYICLQCDFVIHRDCIDLPRVININRHDHRISFTLHLGAGYSKCGVCRQYISQYKGAYSCYVCPNYAVHTRCALEGWDRTELVGIPDDTEEIAPFKVVGDDLICHFSHEEHPLKLHNEDIIHNKYKQCEACSHQVGFSSIYVCEECCFFLHEKCANLPMKKRFEFDFVPYTLEGVRKTIYCSFCKMYSHGFTYTSPTSPTSPIRNVDVHCGSLSEPFIHDGHLHPLYFATREFHICDGCKRRVYRYLCCDDCEFYLCFVCTSLPKKIWCRNDEHPLTLCFGEKANNKYWCDICEKDLDPSELFYTCSDCGVTFHVKCVLGEFSRLIPKTEFNHEMTGKRVVVVLNNHNTRPLCSQCHSRCMASVILKYRNEHFRYMVSIILKYGNEHSRCMAPFIRKYPNEDNEYFCSSSCLYNSMFY